MPKKGTKKRWSKNKKGGSAKSEKSLKGILKIKTPEKNPIRKATTFVDREYNNSIEQLDSRSLKSNESEQINEDDYDIPDAYKKDIRDDILQNIGSDSTEERKNQQINAAFERARLKELDKLKKYNKTLKAKAERVQYRLDKNIKNSAKYNKNLEDLKNKRELMTPEDLEIVRKNQLDDDDKHGRYYNVLGKPVKVEGTLIPNENDEIYYQKDGKRIPRNSQRDQKRKAYNKKIMDLLKENNNEYPLFVKNPNDDNNPVITDYNQIALALEHKLKNNYNLTMSEIKKEQEDINFLRNLAKLPINTLETFTPKPSNKTDIIPSVPKRNIFSRAIHKIAKRVKSLRKIK
jgi:hypothetical protein